MQATLAPPATGKMLKGLMLCYSVILATFYSASVSGYWVFGNKSNSNILKSLMPDEGPSLAPTWVLGLAIVFILLQLFAIGLVSHALAAQMLFRQHVVVYMVVTISKYDTGILSSCLRNHGKELG